MAENVYTAINAVMKEVGYVQKDKTNPHFRYSYASEAALIEAIRPEMVKQGLVLVPLGLVRDMQYIPVPDSRAGNLVYLSYAFKLVHGPTQTETPACEIPCCGQDGGDKGPYKAATGALKYFLRHLFLIETGDDPEADSGGDERTEPAARPKQTDPPPPGSVAAVRAELFAEFNAAQAGLDPSVIKACIRACLPPDTKSLNPATCDLDILRDCIARLRNATNAPGGAK